MKYQYLYIASLLLLLSCSSDDDENSKPDLNLLGTWQLTSFYSDPGDGSGDFEPINSSKTVTFKLNSEINSNADLCTLFSEVGMPSTGTYSKNDGTISITDCNNQPVSLFYDLSEGVLTLSYLCFEACQEKYKKEN